MKIFKKLCLFIGLLLIVALLGVTLYKSNYDEKIVEVIKWNNLYNEDSIEMFYFEEDKRLEVLDTTYKIKELSKDQEDEISKVLKIVDMVNSIVEYDDVADRPYTNAYDILRMLEDGKKASGRDMAIITRDFINSIGIVARVGEFRSGDNLLSKSNNYYVIEFWSNEYNKWVMIDFIDKGYFTTLGIPSSATEICGLNNKQIQYVGNRSQKEYLKNRKSIFNNYTIAIDNTLDMKKSNTYVTFVKEVKDIELIYNNKFLPPTVFTTEVKLFNKSPFEKKTIADEGIYIVLMKSTSDNNRFVVGAFNNGKIIDEYYLKMNGDEYKKIYKYIEIDLLNEINEIEVSRDGVESISSIELKLNR